MGETESAYHYASRSFSRLGEFSFKTYAIFDLLDILTLQERLEIGWGKPLLRSSVNTLKCRHATSPKKKSFLCIWSSSIGRLLLNKNDIRSIWANSRKLLDMLKVLSHLERYDCFVISLLIFKCNAGFDGFSHKVVESPESKAMRRMSMENMQVCYLYLMRIFLTL